MPRLVRAMPAASAAAARETAPERAAHQAEPAPRRSGRKTAVSPQTNGAPPSGDRLRPAAAGDRQGRHDQQRERRPIRPRGATSHRRHAGHSAASRSSPAPASSARAGYMVST